MLSKHTKSHPVSIIQTIPLSPEEHFSPGRAMWQAAAQSTLQLMAEGRLWLDWSTGTLTIHSKIDINTYANAFGRCENQTAHFQFYHVTLDFLFLPRWLRYLSCASWELFGLSLHRLTVLSLEHIYNWHNHTVQTDEFVHVGQCSTLSELWPGPWNGIAKCCIPARILSGGGPFTDPIIRHMMGCVTWVTRVRQWEQISVQWHAWSLQSRVLEIFSPDMFPRSCCSNLPVLATGTSTSSVWLNHSGPLITCII